MNVHKSFTGVEVKDADKGQITAVFSTFGVVDSDGDLTLPGAIKDGTEVVISAYGHTSWGGALPIGKGTIRTTKNEAILEGQFFMGTTGGREHFQVLKELGPLGEWSYSLENVTSKSGEVDGQPIQILESIDVREVSPVLRGAGVDTRTLATKGLKFAEEGAAVVAAVNAYLGRAGEVVALRAEKGREPLSSESGEVVAQLDEALTKLRDLLASESSKDESGDGSDITPEDIKAMAADRLRAELFSNIDTIGA